MTQTPPRRRRPLPFTAIKDLQQALAPPEYRYDIDLIRRLVCGDPKKRNGLGDLSPVFKFLKMVDDGEIALDRKSPSHFGSPTSFRSMDCGSSDVFSCGLDPFKFSGSVDCADQVDRDVKNAVLADTEDQAIPKAVDLDWPLFTLSSSEGNASDSGSEDDIVLLPRGGNAIPQKIVAAAETSSTPLQTTSKPLQTRSTPLQTRSTPLQTRSTPLQTRSTPLQTRSTPLQTGITTPQTSSTSQTRSEAKLPTFSTGMFLQSTSHRIESLRELLPPLFHEDEETILQALGTPQTAQSGVHVFVDLSNINVGLSDFVRQRPHLLPAATDRRLIPSLDFNAFSCLTERGRPVAKRVVISSWPTNSSDPFNKIVENAKKCGYDTTILQRVQRQQNGHQPPKPLGAQKSPQKSRVEWHEQGVDEIIHLKIADSLLFETPQTIVLATGDGAKAAMSGGFLRYVEKALEQGWKVELVAWQNSTNSRYLDLNWQLKWKNQFRFIDLENFAMQIIEIVPQLARPDPSKRGVHRPSPLPSRNI